MAESTSQAHPLFTLGDDDDPDAEAPEVGVIVVTRWDGGRKMTAPRTFRASELQSLEELFATFGGGKYELIARSVDNSRITARRSYELPGPSKNLFEEDGKAAAPAAASGPDAGALMALLRAQQAPAPGFNAQTVVALLGVLAPVAQQYFANSAAQATAQAQQQQAFLTAMITNSQSQTDKVLQTMATLYNARPSGTPVQSGSFMDGVEWVQNYLAGQGEARTDSDEPGIKDIVGLAQAWLETQRGAGNGNGSAPPPAMGGGS